eukprot:1140339-Pelagomonas_calceolata.AAC.2
MNVGAHPVSEGCKMLMMEGTEGRRGLAKFWFLSSPCTTYQRFTAQGIWLCLVHQIGVARGVRGMVSMKAVQIFPIRTVACQATVREIAVAVAVRHHFQGPFLILLAVNVARPAPKQG